MSSLFQILDRLVYAAVAIEHNDGIIRIRADESYLLFEREDKRPRFIKIRCKCGGQSNKLTFFCDEKSFLEKVRNLGRDKAALAFWYFHPHKNGEKVELYGYCQKCKIAIEATVQIKR